MAPARVGGALRGPAQGVFGNRLTGSGFCNPFSVMKKKTTNVEKLVDAGLVSKADLSNHDEKVINDLSDEEIDAILATGQKVLAATKPGEKVAKVGV